MRLRAQLAHAPLALDALAAERHQLCVLLFFAGGALDFVGYAVLDVCRVGRARTSRSRRTNKSSKELIRIHKNYYLTYF